MEYVLLLVGFVLLVKGADFFEFHFVRPPRFDFVMGNSPMSARPGVGRLGLHQRRRDAVGLAGHSENIFLQSVSTSAVGLMGSMMTEIVGSLALTAYTGE